MTQLAKTLMILGAVLVVLGAVLWLGDRFGLGRLPGDLQLRGKNFTVNVPLATSLVVSVVLTVLLNLWLRNR